MKKGMWVASDTDIGLIRHIHADKSLDIIIHHRDGTVIGRRSPAMGGPSKYEPCCDPSGWKVIEKPAFPLPVRAYVKDIVTFR